MASEAVLANHYSWSQLNMFMRCPRQYYNKYVLNLPQWPVYDMVSGKACHAALEEHNKEVARGHVGLRVKQMLEVGIATIEQTPGIEDLDVPLPQAKDQFQRDVTEPLCEYLVACEVQQLDSERAENETDVERELVWEFEGHTFLGYADLVLPSRVVDYKLLGRAKSAQQIERDGQLTLYGMHLDRPAGFVQLIRGQDRAFYTPQVQTPAIREGVLASIRSTIKSIDICKQTGHWPMTDSTNWSCSVGRCQFWQRCFSSTAAFQKE